jgi:putative flippase GtrA
MPVTSDFRQIVRFALVGGSGYVVNLAVYAGCVHGMGADYRVAAVLAFLVALSTNFALNRHYTFDARDGRLHHQAPRFVVVSLASFGVSLLALQLLVDVADAPKVLGQAIAILVAAPMNFIGQRLWAFAPALTRRRAA